jgi:hypothetical protein
MGNTPSLSYYVYGDEPTKYWISKRIGRKNLTQARSINQLLLASSPRLIQFPAVKCSACTLIPSFTPFMVLSPIPPSFLTHRLFFATNVT